MSSETTDQPPDAKAAKLRLMICWANARRSWLEDPATDEEGDRAKSVSELTDWFETHLGPSATEAERNRHRREFGTWAEREVINDSWDTQAAMPLVWALHLETEDLPAWDQGCGWHPSTDDFFHYPDPDTWRPNLQLLAFEAIDRMGMIYETCMWRIRCAEHGSNSRDYILKLMGRASQLGHVHLAEDRDLALSDGRSFSGLTQDEISELGSIVSERLRSLNWLCGQEQDWDSISGDSIVSWLWDQEWGESQPKSKSLLGRLLDPIQKRKQNGR